MKGTERHKNVLLPWQSGWICPQKRTRKSYQQSIKRKIINVNTPLWRSLIPTLCINQQQRYSSHSFISTFFELQTKISCSKIYLSFKRKVYWGIITRSLLRILNRIKFFRFRCGILEKTLVFFKNRMFKASQQFCRANCCTARKWYEYNYLNEKFTRVIFQKGNNYSE